MCLTKRVGVAGKTPNETKFLEEEVGYWRKANQIHGWFVKHVQGGVDDCSEYPVSLEQLRDLQTLCQKILEMKESVGDYEDYIDNHLPPAQGFFFGSGNVDGYYFTNLERTLCIVEDCLGSDSNEFYYQSSW